MTSAHSVVSNAAADTAPSSNYLHVESYPLFVHQRPISWGGRQQCEG